MNVLVVGAGAMGTWFARTLGASVAFVDEDQEVAREAASTVDGRVLEPGTREEFDVVCLAVPMDALEAAARDHAHRASGAVVDVTGVMGRALAVLETVAPDRERASFHPLFAPANAPGRIAVVPAAPGPTTEWLRDRLAAAGNQLFETTAAEHDRAMETVQAAAHAAILSYGIAREEIPEAFHTPISATLTDLVDQVTGGTPGVYADIQTSFDGADRLAAAAESIAAADREAFLDLYERAGRDRSDGAPTGRPTQGDGE